MSPINPKSSQQCGKLEKSLNARMPKAQQHAFYIAHIGEEIGGRPAPGAPIKLMSQDPRNLGEKVAQLIEQRFTEVDVKSLECIARVKLISLLLKSSYLVIRLEYPPEHIYTPKRSKAFSSFADGMRSAFNAKKSDRPIIERRRKPDLSRY